MANSAGDAGGSELEIRKKMLEDRAVDVMISVGPNFFYTVTLPCTLWFLDRGKKKADPTYIYYVFKSSETVQRIHNQAFSSGVPHINLEILRDFEIELPQLHVQQRIASILSAYDDLIENNTRRIKTLEEMAQMLYRQWFVSFRFSGEYGKKRADLVGFINGIPLVFIELKASHKNIKLAYPAKPLGSYHVSPTTTWVDPPSTGDLRRWGARRVEEGRETGTYCFPSPLISRVEDWRRLPRRLSLSVAPRFLWECLTSGGLGRRTRQSPKELRLVADFVILGRSDRQRK